MKFMRRLSFLLIGASVLCASCATQKKAQKTEQRKPAAAKDAAGAVEAAPAAPPTEVAEASLRTGGDFALRDELKAVPFDFDSAKLSDDALAILKANAAILNDDPTIEALVSGHCDERGTTAYNLALGQKRAKETRDYYIRLGVDGARIATISYGKEQPLCSESNDACWSQNRRAETRARPKK